MFKILNILLPNPTAKKVFTHQQRICVHYTYYNTFLKKNVGLYKSKHIQVGLIHS